jgi:hypothetical protein
VLNKWLLLLARWLFFFSPFFNFWHTKMWFFISTIVADSFTSSYSHISHSLSMCTKITHRIFVWKAQQHSAQRWCSLRFLLYIQKIFLLLNHLNIHFFWQSHLKVIESYFFGINRFRVCASTNLLKKKEMWRRNHFESREAFFTS